MKNKITQSELKKVLHYEYASGVFTWLESRGRIKAGSKAGALNKRLGYVSIGINKQDYYGHRLAWFYMTGAWPNDGIDHIDGNRCNNIFTNLRQATQAQNLRNQKIHFDNKSGYKGVSWNKRDKKWTAQICVDYKQYNLGGFATPEEASIVRNNAAKKLHAEFSKVS